MTNWEAAWAAEVSRLVLEDRVRWAEALPWASGRVAVVMQLAALATACRRYGGPEGERAALELQARADQVQAMCPDRFAQARAVATVGIAGDASAVSDLWT